MSRILQYACACALVVVGRAFADEGPSSPSSKGAIAAAECFKAASSLEQGGFYRSAAARWRDSLQSIHTTSEMTRLITIWASAG